MKIPADLHLHSRHSDGTLTVPQLLALVRKAGVTLAALTDHDTLAGVREARREALSLDMEIVPGVEISAGFTAGKGLEEKEVHILGYFFRPNDPALLELLAWNQDSRHRRNRSILRRLHLHGIDLDPELFSGDKGSLGRPHIATQMVALGAVKSIGSAFQVFLRDGGRAWVRRELLPVKRVTEVIRAAGGIPVLAHPGKSVEPAELPLLVAQGVAGLEVHHPAHHDYGYREKLLAFCRENKLWITGGSDYHGHGLPYAPPWYDGLEALKMKRALRVA